MKTISGLTWEGKNYILFTVNVRVTAIVIAKVETEKVIVIVIGFAQLLLHYRNPLSKINYSSTNTLKEVY